MASNLFVTLLGVLFLVFCYWNYANWFNSLATVPALSSLEKRVLKWQLLALAIWTLFCAAVFVLAVWFGTQVLISTPGIEIIAVVNWVLVGFIAFTSIVPAVSIVGMRYGKQPIKGTVSAIWGILMLAFLVVWTYLTARPHF